MASDVMRVRLHLRQVRVLAVAVDTPSELVVEVESAVRRPGCPACGFCCARVHDARRREIRDLYETGQLPELHDIVDTIIARSDEILAQHHTDRASNGRIEGTNNLLQVLRRTAHGFTNPTNFEARGLLTT